MKELKTLKDLKNKTDKKGEYYYGDETCDFCKELKAVSVKWVKKWKSQEEDSSVKETKMYWSGKKQSMMDFFNLTEEDLKDE